MMATCARACGDIASSAAPAVAKSSCRMRATSGTGVAGAALRSVTAPTQSEHSRGASAATSGRARSDRLNARKTVRFMVAGLKGLMLLNPSSGVKLPPELEDSARAAGLEVVRVCPDLDCSSLIRERMRDGRRLFVAAGGDGTVNNVIQSLVHTDATLGVIPIGTYNHFARDLGIPLVWREALEVVA